MDHTLVMSGAAGAEPTWEDRVVAELPGLRAFVARLGRGHAADLDDLIQDVAARALRYRNSFDATRGTLGPWLRTMALRLLIDQRARSARASPAIDADAVAAAVAQPPVEHRDTLAHALARLHPVERDVLLRFHGNGDSIEDISRALAMPAGTVKSHLHRARRKLATRDGTEDQP